jgi:hypothetical protein
MGQQKHYNILPSNTTSFQITYKTTSYRSCENITFMNFELKLLTFFKESKGECSVTAHTLQGGCGYFNRVIFSVCGTRKIFGMDFIMDNFD